MMDRSFDVAQVVDGPPTWWTVLRRGARKRCGRCGGGDLFQTRYRLRARCPGCGYRFEREPGFFAGAWFLNFMVVETAHFVLVMVFIAWKSQNPDAGLRVPLIVGIATGIALPILCYPWSQTTWAAIDLAMSPLELSEIVDAADATDEGDPTAQTGSEPPDGSELSDGSEPPDGTGTETDG